MKLLVFSDIHFHNHGQFSQETIRGVNSRARHCGKVVEQIGKLVDEQNVEGVLFCGDMFERYDHISSSVAQYAKEVIAENILSKVPMFVIGGNHDASLDHPEAFSSVGLFDGLDNYFVLSDEPVEYGKYQLYGFSAHEELKPLRYRDKKMTALLLLHIILKGMKLNDAGGTDILSKDGMTVEELEQYLHDNRVAKCFIGDLHNRERVSNIVTYVGSCIAKTFNDERKLGRGVTIVEGTYKETFIELEYPRFKTISGDRLAEYYDDDYNYYRVTFGSGEQFRQLVKAMPPRWNFVYQQPVEQTAKRRSDVSLEESHASALAKWLAKRQNCSDGLKSAALRLGKKILEKVGA